MMLSLFCHHGARTGARPAAIFASLSEVSVAAALSSLLTLCQIPDIILGLAASDSWGRMERSIREDDERLPGRVAACRFKTA